MDARETAQVLGYLSAAYPRNELHEETVLVWIDQFENADPAMALRAAKRIVASDEWFPSISRFREVLGLEIRQSQVSEHCSDCDNGFVLDSRGDARFCRRCRSDAARDLVGPTARSLRGADWGEWVAKTRKELENTSE